jgi:RHS repeat-associated protein
MRSAGLPLTVGYTGHRWDPAIGQYFAPFRYYNPQTARWNMRDPLGMLAGLNTYAYVAASPVNYTDSLGLCPNPNNIDLKPFTIHRDLLNHGGPHVDITKKGAKLARVSIFPASNAGEVISGSTKGLGRVISKLKFLGWIPGILLTVLTDFLIFPPTIDAGVKDPPPGYHWTSDWKLERDPDDNGSCDAPVTGGIAGGVQ